MQEKLEERRPKLTPFNIKLIEANCKQIPLICFMKTEIIKCPDPVMKITKCIEMVVIFRLSLASLPFLSNWRKIVAVL